MQPRPPDLPAPSDGGVPGAAPETKSGLAFFGMLLALNGVLGSLAQVASPLLGLTWSEAFTLVLPAVAAAAGSNLRVRHALLLARRPSPPELGLALLLAVVGFGGAIAVQALAALLVPARWLVLFDPARLFDRPLLERIALSVLAATAAPLCEEIAFRGYLLTVLRTRHRPAIAIGLSALAFAAIHFDPLRFAPLVLLGTLFAWMAWRSGSLWPAVVAHAMNNALGVLAAAMARNTGLQRGPPELGPTLAFSLPVLGLAVVGLAMLLPAYRRWTPHPPPVDAALVRRDPADPSIRFRPRRVPGPHRAAAQAAVVSLGALAVLALLRSR